MDIGHLMTTMVIWLAGGVGVLIASIAGYLWFIRSSQMKGM